MKDKSKSIPGPFKEVVDGPTEHGGCFMVTYYFDSRYKPIVKDRATRAIVHEYDEKSRSVHRDYLTMDKGAVVVPRVKDEPSPAPAEPSSAPQSASTV